MSEERDIYQTQNENLLRTPSNHATMPAVQLNASPDWQHLERMLIPLLNYARRMQGKKPVIVPRG
jgi:hypothetical protein